MVHLLSPASGTPSCHLLSLPNRGLLQALTGLPASRHWLLSPYHRPRPQGTPHHLGSCSWGAGDCTAGPHLGRWQGGMVPSAGHASHPILLPTDELELVLQDGQRCVRARHSLSEGLSWGPFRGNIQSRASSPGQVEPVRSPDPSSPPTSCRTAARAESGPGHRALPPLEPSPSYTPAQKCLSL